MVWGYLWMVARYVLFAAKHTFSSSRPKRKGRDNKGIFADLEVFTQAASSMIPMRSRFHPCSQLMDMSAIIINTARLPHGISTKMLLGSRAGGARLKTIVWNDARAEAPLPAELGVDRSELGQGGGGTRRAVLSQKPRRNPWSGPKILGRACKGFAALPYWCPWLLW